MTALWASRFADVTVWVYMVTRLAACRSQECETSPRTKIAKCDEIVTEFREPTPDDLDQFRFC